MQQCNCRESYYGNLGNEAFIKMNPLSILHFVKYMRSLQAFPVNVFGCLDAHCSNLQKIQYNLEVLHVCKNHSTSIALTGPHSSCLLFGTVPARFPLFFLKFGGMRLNNLRLNLRFCTLRKISQTIYLY